MKYDSFKYRIGKQEFDTLDKYKLMDILIEFGKSIDPHGYDGGDYSKAVKSLLKLIDDSCVKNQEIIPTVYMDDDNPKIVWGKNE